MQTGIPEQHCRDAEGIACGRYGPGCCSSVAHQLGAGDGEGRPHAAGLRGYVCKSCEG